ncbi:MAG: hypothetical protein AAGB48_03915 [Planctomycetota bacterium]
MKLSTLARPIAAALALLVAPAFTPAAAAPHTHAAQAEPDVIKTTDGRELSGTIVRELNGYVWLDMGVGSPLMFRPDEIAEIVRDSGVQAGADPVIVSDEERDWVDDPSITRAAILTAEGPVGVQMSAKPLREAIPLLKEEGVELVVLKVKSGGGLGIEVQRLSDVIHNELKKEFQIVAWIEDAISAAAMTALTLETIYFMPKGTFGAATGWSGQLKAVEGRSLEQFLYQMEKISARGNYDEAIMRAMQINVPLSYDYDETTGEYDYYESTEGEFVLNDGEYILTFNAETAEAAGFSKGTAATLDELTRILQKSVGEIEWVGVEIAGEPYPIAKAELHQREWREEVTFQERRFQEIYIKYEMEIGNATSVAIESRGGFIRAAQRYLQRIKRMVEINPNFGLLQGITDEWFLQQEERLRRLRR